jgi:hypothetical protein
MRKVIYAHRNWTTEFISGFPHAKCEKSEREALFHQFGMSCDEDSGLMWSVAILELNDGTVITVAADDIIFV